MRLEICRIDSGRNIDDRNLKWLVQAIYSFSKEVSKEEAVENASNLSNAFSYYAMPAFSNSGYNTNFFFDKDYILRENQQTRGNGNPAALASYCRKHGLLKDYDDCFELSPIGELLLSKAIDSSEYAFWLLSKQWIMVDNESKRNLLAFLYECIENDEDFLQLFISRGDDLKKYIFEKVVGRSFDKHLDKIDFSRFDILINTLLFAGLLSQDGDTYTISPAAEAIWEEICRREDDLTSYDRVDDDFYRFMCSNKTGAVEIIDSKNSRIFAALYPNLVKTKGFHMNNQSSSNNEQSRQIIYYGAPGTGKSHEVNKVTCEVEKETKENNEAPRVFRTTFHPDSDYSTFVGSYKPSMRPAANKQTILDYDSLVDKFKEYLAADTNITRACTQFGFDYHDSIVKMQENNAHTIPALVADAYKSGTTYDTQVRSGMSVYETSYRETGSDEKIIYSFIPQAFINAYIRAWETDKPVYLVIEEINRGNCAQIFGDLFQLLDRDENLESKYPISPDADLQVYLLSHMNKARENTLAEIRKGEKMKLPSNLYIWATMNTSDQSLFPIDSAFKRRWDWKYMKIVNHADKNYQIVAKDHKYSWWDFIDKMNGHINSLTSSEDKKLGYFFVHKENGEITAQEFVNKVLFYLYNDALKDYNVSLNVTIDGKKKAAHFSDFYDDNGKVIADRVIEALDEFLHVSSINENSEEQAQ